MTKERLQYTKTTPFLFFVMKRKHVMIISISAFMLFYFLVPTVGVEWGCQIKNPPLGIPNGNAGGTVRFSLGMYTIIFLNGGHLEIGNTICSWN